MYQKFYLSFVLIVVAIAGNGVAKFLLVDVPEEKGTIEKGDGKWKFHQRVINNKLDNDTHISNTRERFKRLFSF